MRLLHVAARGIETAENAQEVMDQATAEVRLRLQSADEGRVLIFAVKCWLSS